MKTKLLLTLSFFTFSLGLTAQQAELSFKTDVDCNDNKYCATIELKALNGNEITVGTSSIFLNYNADALQFDSYKSLSFDKSKLCVANEFPAYSEHQFDASYKGILNTTIELTTPEFACPTVNETAIDIAEICFTILKYDENSELTFKARHTNLNKGQEEVELIDGINMINKNETISCKTSTSISDVSNVSSVEVGPNPLQDYLNIVLNAKVAQDVDVTVYDLSGKRIVVNSFSVTKGLNEYRVDVKNLPSAVYVLEIEGNDFTTSHKVVKK